MFLFLFVVDDFFELDELMQNHGFDHLRILAKVLPQIFCRFSLGFFWPSGASSFFWVGGVPLAAFSRVFPLVLGWVVGAICVFCLVLLHLASAL